MNIAATQNAAFAKLRTAEILWHDASKHALALADDAKSINKVLKAKKPQPVEAADLLKKVVQLQARITQAQTQAEEAAAMIKPAVDDLVTSLADAPDFRAGETVVKTQKELVPHQAMSVPFTSRREARTLLIASGGITGIGTGMGAGLLADPEVTSTLASTLLTSGVMGSLTAVGVLGIAGTLRGGKYASKEYQDVNTYLSSLARVLAMHATEQLPADRKGRRALTDLGTAPGSFKQTFENLSQQASTKGTRLAKAQKPIEDSIRHAGSVDYFEHQAVTAKEAAERSMIQLSANHLGQQVAHQDLVASMLSREQQTITEIAEVHARANDDAARELKQVLSA